MIYVIKLHEMLQQEAKREKATWKEFLLTVFLLAMFPVLWFFNQRINYRKFLTLNTKFGLNANTYPADQLSDPTLILKYFQKHDPSYVITAEMITSPGFDVIGREITNGSSLIEVYEYQSPRAANAKLKNIINKPELYGQISDQIYIYKNVLIFDRSQSESVKALLKGLTDETNN